MQFRPSTIQAIMEDAQANGCTSATLLVTLLRPQLAASFSVNRAALAAGVPPSAIADTRVRTYYAVGCAYTDGGWLFNDAISQLEGFGELEGVVLATIETLLPNFALPSVDLKPHENGARIGLHRHGHGDVTVVLQEIKEGRGVWAEVHLFHDQQKARIWLENETKTRKKARPAMNLVRR